MIQTTGFTELCSVLSRYYLKLDGCRVDIERSGREKRSVTEAGSGVVSEQRNRLIATIKFICAEIQKRKSYKKRVIANKS